MRVDTEQASILFPPFKLADQFVVGGHWGNTDEVDRLVSLGKVTILDQAISPKPNFVLWVAEGAINYDSSATVAEQWARAAAFKIEEASRALIRGSFDDVRRLAKYAFAMDENRFDAIALQVAAASRLNNRKAVNALTRLGYSLIDRFLFDDVVRKLLRQLSSTNWAGQYGRTRSIELEQQAAA